ncbi:MAG: hypothetical protein MUP85_16000 [Candidatus Lokiarchaeota archaeon]|nr:hypothetical protein [Candidatus Lokiarchaeota archaeon]
MKPKMIIMLTYNDKTVSNALETFDQCKELPVECWGFKNVGLPVEKMKKLIFNMKEAKKTTFLEVVTYHEKSCLDAAKLALECQFDYFTGSIYFESVHNLLKDKPIKYFPFCGKVSGSPSILGGSIQEIIDDAKLMEEKGVDGFDLLAYRYIEDAEKLAQQFIKAIKIPVVLAGSINSFDRLDKIKEYNPWGFTIGSAFFDKIFVKAGSFKEQISRVLSYID